MNIAVISHTFPKNKNDSTAAFLHSFVLGLKNTENRCVVVVPYIKDLYVGDFPYKVITYKYIWPKFLHTLGYATTLKRGLALPFKAYIIAPFLFIFGTIKLTEVVRHEKIDVISSHWLLPSGLMALVASKLTGIPYVVTLPGSDVYIAGMNSLFKKLAVFAANKARAVIADSPIFVDKIKKLGAKLKQTQIIPYPVDTEKYRPDKAAVNILKERLGLDSGNIIVLAVGRLVEKKGFKYLIEAMRDIVRVSSQTRLLIIGDGDLRVELESLSQKLKVKKYVLFIGSVNRDKISSYYNMADIFVMPSIADKKGNIDDQPVALLEAMSCGLPVVATNFPGISLSVENGVNGILTPQKNVLAIRKAVVCLLPSYKLRDKMGKESRKIALSKFSIQKIGERYNGIFEKILNER